MDHFVYVSLIQITNRLNEGLK